MGDGWSSVHEGPQSKEAGNSLQPIPQPLSMYDTGLHFMKTTDFNRKTLTSKIDSRCH